MAQGCSYVRGAPFILEPMSFQARDNITLFADCCVALGMRRSDVCNYSNFERGDLKQITATLCAFAKLGIPKGLHQVSKELETYVEKAYNPAAAQMDLVSEEEEIQLTPEELEALERELLVLGEGGTAC